MIKMSFAAGHNGDWEPLDRSKLINFIENTDKRIEYTYGFTYRNPTTCHKVVDKDEAINIVSSQGFLDAEEFEDYLHLNAFSANDMW